jgi:hypothetical protein
MNLWKSSLIVLVVLGGLEQSAQAQQGNAPDRRYPTYPGPGTNGDFYSITNGFGPYGLPGSYPRYSGFGLSGYGQGAILNEYFVPWPGPGVKPSASATSKPAPKTQKSSRTAPKSAPKAMTSRKPTVKTS